MSLDRSVQALGKALAGDGSTWIVVSLPGGRQGFIAERLLSSVPPSAAVAVSEGQTCADNLDWYELLMCQDAVLAAKAAEYQRLEEALRRTPQLAAQAPLIVSAQGWLERQASCEADTNQRSCLLRLLNERVQAINTLLAANANALESPSRAEPSIDGELVDLDRDADGASESVTDPANLPVGVPLSNDIDPPDVL